jgi:hypothetical protein
MCKKKEDLQYVSQNAPFSLSLVVISTGPTKQLLKDDPQQKRYEWGIPHQQGASPVLTSILGR